jgi:glycosyltransferase involved in cell wall biosynthesis
VPTYRFEEPGPTLQKLMVVDPLLLWKLRQVLAGYEFDVIHAHHYEGVAVALAARGRRSIPIVYDAHTMLESELPAYGPNRSRIGAAAAGWIGARIDRALPRLADHVVAVSERIRDKLVADSGIPCERIDVIANGVEWELFPERGSAPACREQPVIIYAGGLAPYQGIDLLLHSFHEVLRTLPGATLRIATHTAFDSYEPLAASLGVRSRIEILPGRLEELPGVLADADIAVNPRTACDGVPFKLLNYMAAGLPIVSFEGSAPTLTHSETGWLVEDGNVPAFARAIVHLAANPDVAHRLGRSARSKGQALYTWDDAAFRVRSVYERLLVGQSPARPLFQS